METLELETVKTQIEKEFGESIEIIKDFEDFVMFKDQYDKRFTNKLTKTGKHKKNSIRISTF